MPWNAHQSDHSNETFYFVVMQELEISICQRLLETPKETNEIKRCSAGFVFNLNG